ncbi:hypothetical protein [Paracoccus sediminicola]|uniref:hypothetical protein n=1 Tax=Paracoccus sediminicola TaxID=3017783 RepID=UPI0022F0CE8F|nr:hypothetical protein [Paracoccus sediminicola]WBU56893.1 hypothetical protein PAF18_00135 [Paracoccus sediminicola]
MDRPMRAALIGCLLISLAGTALAQVSEDRIRAQLAAQGYENITFTQADGRVEVTAVRGKLRILTIYDLETGEILLERVSQRNASAGDATDTREEAAAMPRAGDPVAAESRATEHREDAKETRAAPDGEFENELRLSVPAIIIGDSGADAFRIDADTDDADDGTAVPADDAMTTGSDSDSVAAQPKGSDNGEPDDGPVGSDEQPKSGDGSGPDETPSEGDEPSEDDDADGGGEAASGGGAADHDGAGEGDETERGETAGDDARAREVNDGADETAEADAEESDDSDDEDGTDRREAGADTAPDAEGSAGTDAHAAAGQEGEGDVSDSDDPGSGTKSKQGGQTRKGSARAAASTNAAERRDASAGDAEGRGSADSGEDGDEG